jgi:hypothetical protein
MSITCLTSWLWGNKHTTYIDQCINNMVGYSNHTGSSESFLFRCLKPSNFYGAMGGIFNKNQNNFYQTVAMHDPNVDQVVANQPHSQQNIFSIQPFRRIPNEHARLELFLLLRKETLPYEQFLNMIHDFVLYQRDQEYQTSTLPSGGDACLQSVKDFVDTQLNFPQDFCFPSNIQKELGELREVLVELQGKLIDEFSEEGEETRQEAQEKYLFLAYAAHYITAFLAKGSHQQSVWQGYGHGQVQDKLMTNFIAMQK